MCITLEFGASMFDMNGLEFGYVFYLNEEMCVCVCACHWFYFSGVRLEEISRMPCFMSTRKNENTLHMLEGFL